MKKMNTYRSEIDFTETGIFLNIEATISEEDFNALVPEGWEMVNNGMNLDTDPSVDSIYFFKAYSK